MPRKRGYSRAYTDCTRTMRMLILTGHLGGALGVGAQEPQGALEVTKDALVEMDHRVLDGLVDCTVEVWVKTAGSSQAVLSAANAGEDNELLIFGLNPLQVSIKGVDWNTGVRLGNNHWHHIALVRQGESGLTTLYVDAQQQGQRTLPAGPLVVEEGGLYIGQEQDRLGGGFSRSQALVGLLDELRVWEQTRDFEAIAPLIHTTLGGDEEGLVGYWRFETLDPDSTVADLSPQRRPVILGGEAALVETVVPLGEGLTFFGGVVYPLGAASFADEVVLYQKGRRVEAPYDTAEVTVGPPVPVEGQIGWMALGDDGVLVLRFNDNALVDQDAYMNGLDLFIYEIGTSVEGFDVDISIDGEEWIELGRVRGQPTGIDIGPFVESGARFSYVRLRDDNVRQSGPPFAGADIDAVGAIGSFAQTPEGTGDFNGDGQVDFEDLFLFSDHFGLRRGQEGWDADYDLLVDGVVNEADLEVLRRVWPAF